MKKLLGIVFLGLLLSGNTYAKESWELKDREWVPVDGNEKIKLIVDNKSILKEDENNNNLSVALISIFSEPYWDKRIAGPNINNKIALSHVTKWEINCTDKKLRIILQNWFDKKMPNGFTKDVDLRRFVVELMRNGEVVESPADLDNLTKVYTQEAVNFIRDNKDRPFFILLSHNLLNLSA